MVSNIKLILGFLFLVSFSTLAKENKIEITSESFLNVSAKGGEENAKIYWGLGHNEYAHLDSIGARLIISYNTKIGKKRSEKGGRRLTDRGVSATC